MSPGTVADDPQRERFELTLDGSVLGFAAYRRLPGLIAFIHTEIESEHEGEGLGSALVAGALDSVRSEGLALLPFCPFVRGYIERHPAYLDLVPVERRGMFGLDHLSPPGPPG